MTAVIVVLAVKLSRLEQPERDQDYVSITSFGVSADKTPAQNAVCMQNAIDWAADRGAALYITPVEGGYPMDGGLILKKNVFLVGAQGPTGRGTCNSKGEPTGSLFRITDKTKPFITVQTATGISGVQFYYPEQSVDNPNIIIEYPATIQVDKSQPVQGVTLRDLTFYGEWMAMDFRAGSGHCEQILFEDCYGYPLSGQFIAIDFCYDIPRILHCHVNPANMRAFGKTFNRAIMDSVVERKTYTYWVDHTDNAQFMDLFTFGTYGGVYLGSETYGQLTNFNFDCVCNGIYKDGSNTFNRNWQVSQGSIIANVSPAGGIKNIHPIIACGKGHLALSNVECVSGDNPVLSNYGQSYDYLYVGGDSSDLTVSVYGSRMRNYTQDKPITLANPNARIRVRDCVDKNGRFFNFENN